MVLCTTTILAGEGAIGTDSVFIFHEVIAGGGGASKGLDGFIWCSGKHDQYL